MTHPTIRTYPPVPGIWIDRAQHALDALAGLTSSEEVVAAFGTVRVLVTEVLGAPTAGGSGTRRAVRAVGQLLQTPLGPALAADALSWAASVGGSLDPATVAELLERVADSEVVHRPLRLADRDVVLSHLEGLRTEAQRCSRLVQLWRDVADEVDLRPDPGVAVPDPNPIEWWTSDADEDAAMAAWLRDELEPAVAPTSPPPAPTAADVLAAGSVARQLGVLELLPAHERAKLARSEALFDLDLEVVACCLQEDPKAVFANPQCPDGLRERVRHPHDAATLELAVRLGARHYEVARVRRRLLDVGPAGRLALREAHPVAFLEAMRDCGLATAELLRGELCDVDLSDPATAQAVLGTARHWRWCRPPAQVVEVLLHHPQGPDLAWMLIRNDVGVVVVPDLARRLVDEGPDRIARVALRDLPVGSLLPSDAALALEMGPYWAARCPGIPGEDRPARRLRHALAVRLELDEHAEIPAPGPFRYPDRIEALCRPHPAAPGWFVSLPADADDLRRNARAMQNCTAAYEWEIRCGRGWIVIVHDPQGLGYNVHIHHDGCRFIVGEINSRRNEGDAPDLIRSLFERRLAEDLEGPVEAAEPGLPARRPSDRRDRRRSRARRARRARW